MCVKGQSLLARLGAFLNVLEISTMHETISKIFSDQGEAFRVATSLGENALKTDFTFFLCFDFGVRNFGHSDSD